MSVIDDYINQQPEEYRAGLQSIREAIRAGAPTATEEISYQMPAFRGHRDLVYFALNKHHYGFYPTSAPIVDFAKQLKPYKISKGAIQFSFDQPLPLQLITDITAARVKADRNY